MRLKIIDAHIHFCPEEHFDRIAQAAGHENTAAHLQEQYEIYGIAGAVVMSNRGLELERHRYPAFFALLHRSGSKLFSEGND